MGQVDRGGHVDPSTVTITELLRQRISAWRASGKITGRTAEGYEIAVNIAGPIGQVQVQRLEISHIEMWHLAMRARGLSASSTRAAHGVVRRALADAVKHRLVGRNVAVDHGPPQVGAAARVTAPNADQVRALLARLRGDTFEAPVIVTLFCGLRRGELLALRWPLVSWTKPSCMWSRRSNRVELGCISRRRRPARGAAPSAYPRSWSIPCVTSGGSSSSDACCSA
jgi:integrase